jgi:hypothetical protein
LLDAGYLLLMIGPLAAPLPAPLPLTEAVKSISVNTGGTRGGFQITFHTGKTSPLNLAMLPLGFFDPMITRVVITMVYRGIPQVLMDGVVTRHEIAPSNSPGESTLTLTGEDLSVLMDVVQMRVPWIAVPEAGRVATILAKYAAFGVIPMVIPPLVPSIDSPTSRFDTQDATDRAYLDQLAKANSYVFFVEPGPAPLTSIAYFGPDIRIPVPQPALNVNMDAFTNVESLTFSLDGLAKKQTILLTYDPATGKIPIPVPVPDLNILHPPLGLRPTPPSQILFEGSATRLTPDKAAKRALEIMMSSKDAITGQGSLDVAAYGGILRARMLVGVRGAGITYDGMYYVNTVSHTISPGSYKQSFTLSRDGLIAAGPAVLP